MPDSARALEELVGTARQVGTAIESVIDGKSEAVRLALIVLLAEGHLLIEDVPGVGKTMLAKALARSIDGTVRRIQFTPDLLPSDITGVSAYNQERREFEFKPGPVFANVVVGDEINRASPKTQSAMLECMEERNVTVDGTTHQLERPFMVIATQNPIEMEGTYPLPEAQRDRFTARISIGYPTAAAELEMLDTHGSSSPLDQLKPVATALDVRSLIEAVRGVLVAGQVKEYIIALCAATRTAPELRLGASPRAALHLLRASRARAALDGRDYVIPDDIQALAGPVLAHRLLPTAEALVERKPPEQVVARLVEQTPLPRPLPEGLLNARAVRGADGAGTVVRRGRRGGDRLRAADPRARPGADRCAAARAAAAFRVRRGAGQVPARLRADGYSRAAARRAERVADAQAHERLPAADRAAARRGHRALRPRVAAAVRLRGDRRGRIALVRLRTRVGHPGQVHDRAAAGAGRRLVRARVHHQGLHLDVRPDDHAADHFPRAAAAWRVLARRQRAREAVHRRYRRG
jgi:MoxR-like ATPase